MRWVTRVVLGTIVASILLVAFGVISVRVTVNRWAYATSKAFWQEKKAEAELPPYLKTWVTLARAVKPAVVNVSTTERVRRGTFSDEFFRRFFGEEPVPSRHSLGSGFIASPDGHVVTNYHVVRDAAEIVVRLPDQREFRGRLVGGDVATDLALLKIDATRLTALPFGDSDRLEVGEPVMAIGNPFGLEQTVTTGIVSAKERFIGAGPYDDFIQTDASVNPGNSGGPLIDANGTLVGINSAIFSESGGWTGIGFAIPVNPAKEILPQLRESGKVTRGYLGVGVGPVPPRVATELGMPSPSGAWVREVLPRSPAADAGVETGDVITRFQGETIPGAPELTRRVAATPPGTRVTLTLRRKSGEVTIKATLRELTRRSE
jgi:serine protease Do